jgi:uncharacterized membrane protein
MNVTVIVLRVIHILSGVFWVGSSVILGTYVSPAVAATAEHGQKFMAYLVTKSRITAAITGSAILTVLAGGALYWIDSMGLTSRWTSSGPGLGFGLGALLALVGLVFGILVGRSTAALGSMAAEISGKPTADQLGRINAGRAQLAYAVPISTIALVLALICMATARYWLF